MGARAELAALSTALDDLTARLRGIIGGLEGAEREELSTELEEVERTLDMGRRRLARAISGPRAGGR